ncbi:MAG: SPOR domain-containing protein [Novosphingobium sp.]
MVADEDLPKEGTGENEVEEVLQDNESGEALETGELALDDGDDDRLPWLESDEEYGEEAADGGRLLRFAVLGFIALAAIVGGIWWATHRTPDPTLVADGSTIAAPKEPYKEAPKDAGGKTFQGTGDSAFAVSQGQTQGAGAASPATGADASARPGIAIPPKAPPSASASPAGASSAPAAATGAPGTLVQIGAYSNRASAEAAWGRVSERYSALSGQPHRIAEGQADIGTVFRLQVPAGSADAARTLCGRLKGQGLDCQVK